ncbi:MAG: hypothetical protein ABIP48_20990 [Planctomycetota bacterium]
MTRWDSSVGGPRTRLRLALCVAALVALGLGVTCAPDIEPWLRTPQKRALLFDGVPSYSSPREVEKAGRWSRFRSEKRYVGHSRGCLSRSFKYRVELVTIDEATHLGNAGTLLLTYLNDKLVLTEFRPIRGALYLDRLVTRTPLRMGSRARAKRFRLTGAPRHTRVEVRRSGDRVRITWADERLLKAYWEVQSRGSSRYMK